MIFRILPLLKGKIQHLAEPRISLRFNANFDFIFCLNLLSYCGYTGSRKLASIGRKKMADEKNEAAETKNEENAAPEIKPEAETASETAEKEEPEARAEEAEAPAEPETEPQQAAEPEVKTEEPAPPAEPAAKKKINRMTLVEIEAKLKEVEEQMGGMDSKYAQQLLHRKKTLTS
jgi:hypothetical protein